MSWNKSSNYNNMYGATIKKKVTRIVSHADVQRSLVCGLPPAILQNCVVMFKEVSDSVLDVISRLCPNCTTP